MSGIKTLGEEETNCPVVPYNDNGWKGGSTDEEKKPQKANILLFSQLLIKWLYFSKKKKKKKLTKALNVKLNVLFPLLHVMEIPCNYSPLSSAVPT